MYKIPLSEVKEKILATGSITAEELNSRIKTKINELSGLISEEGATHIIANELGIQIAPEIGSVLKVKEIYSGMRSVETKVKVIQKYDIREFNTGERSGKVCSLLVGDETGTTRLVLWNEQVDLVKDIEPGAILHVKDAYARDNNGKPEVHLGKNGTFELNPEGVVIAATVKEQSFSRKPISELTGDENNVEILGTIVQIFDPRFFFLCPDCNKRVNETDGSYSCLTHGTVVPTLSYVLNLVVDDSTGNIRVVFWKAQTNLLLELNDENFAEFKDNPQLFEEKKHSLLGQQIVMVGRVKKNEMFNRLEFSVQLVNKADPQKELERLDKN